MIGPDSPLKGCEHAERSVRLCRGRPLSEVIDERDVDPKATVACNRALRPTLCDEFDDAEFGEFDEVPMHVLDVAIDDVSHLRDTLGAVFDECPQEFDLLRSELAE